MHQHALTAQVLLAWAFTATALVYGPGGPVPDPASATVHTYVTQSQCERQRLREAKVEDSQGRLVQVVDAACVEVP